MSKSGVSNTPIKQENNQMKKDNRGPNNNTTSAKDNKRPPDNFTSQGGRSHGNQQTQGQNRDRERAENRHDNRHYEKGSGDSKSNDKEEKSSGDQQPLPAGEKKFTGRCRLFVGNLTPDVTEDEFKKMFETYGEISEVYVNTSRGFGFIRLDYRQNAEAAKAALDGLQRKGRVLRVRFATHGAALKVRNLHPYVSNELLEQSFSQFGDLERCVVIVDDRGKPTGEGIVEFVRKPGANSALRRITEGVFLMGADPKPIIVEPLEQKDEEDGMPEKFLTKTDQYKKEREKEPRFAPPGTFEYEFGMRWKQLEELEKQRIEQIKKDTADAYLKLEDEMQNALYEYQAEQIRQDLLRQQEELRRLEEMRNQDRMRRQQELEMRRQQEERQQEERRRADTMMMYRQQELARRPIDVTGMRTREEMMMADRYGDRMPDRLGDRMPDRMSDRMPDRMQDRMPDRMPDRMQDRMPDRMQDRMPDRMQDRMPDRMGSGQPGFMWDEKQREAGMRGEPGRGRGSGAAPLQPPPVPPSGMNAMERGGPGNAPAGGPAPASKGSPKPLMQAGAFGSSAGGASGGGQGPNAATPSAAGTDGNAMDEDCTDEAVTSRLDDAKEADNTEVTSDNSGVSRAGADGGSLRCTNFGTIEINHESEENSTTQMSKSCTNQPEIETSRNNRKGIFDLWETCIDYRLCNNTKDAENSTISLLSEMKSLRETSSLSDDSYNKVMPDHSLKLSEPDHRTRVNNIETSICHIDLVQREVESAVSLCECEIRTGSFSKSNCKQDFHKSKLVDNTKENSEDSSVTHSENTALGSHISPNSVKEYEILSDIKVKRKIKDKPPKCVINLENSSLPSDNFHLNLSIESSDQSYESAYDNCDIDTESVPKERVIIHRYLSSDNFSDPSETTLPSKKTNQSFTLTSDMQTEDNYQPSNVPHHRSPSSNSLIKLQDPHSIKLQPPERYVSSQNSDISQANFDFKCFNGVADINNGAPKNSNFSTKEVLNHNGYLDNDNSNEDSEYRQCIEEYNLGTDEDYKCVDNSEYKQIPPEEEESSYKQTDENKDVVSSYKQTMSEIELSTYKQNATVNAEEMDTETLDEEDAAEVSMSSQIYQSYEEDASAAHYQTAAMAGQANVPALAQYGTTENRDCVWSLKNIAKDDAAVVSPQIPKSDSYTSTQNMVTEAATSSTGDNSISSTCSSTCPPGPKCEENHEAALCTGDQTFKLAAARQAALVSFRPAGCPISYVPGIKPSMYTGAAMVQGMGGPTVLSSSSVHIAQHPGGATIMQHQCMSTGLSGRVAQATVMQQQSISNGVQATALLQHRTLGNGSQTMMVQQRTMTTGLGGMAQQTLVQQRVAGPGSMAPTAMFHVNALRHRALGPQQTNIIQQRGIRLVQTRVMGGSVLPTQPIRNTTILRGSSATPAGMLGHGFVRGMNQGTMMQQLVRQRYLGGPVMPGRGVQVVAGRPIRIKMTYPREMPMDT